MFSVAEKKMIAQKIEEILLELNHPEMPKEKLAFKLHVDGKASWSRADIEPNWLFEYGKPMGYNPFNEVSRRLHKEDDSNGKKTDAQD